MQGIGDEPEGIESHVDAVLGAAGDGLDHAAETASEHASGAVDSAKDEVAEFVHGGDDAEQLDLDDDDRLPWLESADDDYDDAGVDTARVFGFGLAALALLAAIVGGIWWSTHRKADPALVADGSTIAAPSEPYKEAPKDPGGKTFAGTGDTSYAVSQGKGGTQAANGAHLTGGGEAPKPSVDAGPGTAGTVGAPANTAPVKTGNASAGGVAVQVGAFGSQATAEAGWSRLVSQNALLKGVNHRVVEGNADIGKVYRLQAVAGDGAAADALCAKLKAAGVGCQVKK